MAANPIFAASPRTTVTNVTTANTARDGTGTPVSCFTAGSSGSRIERICVKATGTTVVGSVVLFISNGTKAFAYREIPVSAITVGATTASFEYQMQLGLSIQTGYSIMATTTITQTLAITIEGADY
jgi:hypothetical protein